MHKHTPALIAFATAALMTLGSAAHADQAQKSAQIRELIALNGTVQSMEELLPPMTEAMIDALRRSGVSVTSATGGVEERSKLH